MSGRNKYVVKHIMKKQRRLAEQSKTVQKPHFLGNGETHFKAVFLLTPCRKFPSVQLFKITSPQKQQPI